MEDYLLFRDEGTSEEVSGFKLKANRKGMFLIHLEICFQMASIKKYAHSRCAGNHKITEYPELEGTHKDHWAQPLAPHRTTPNPSPSLCLQLHPAPFIPRLPPYPAQQADICSCLSFCSRTSLPGWAKHESWPWRSLAVQMMQWPPCAVWLRLSRHSCALLGAQGSQSLLNPAGGCW